MNRSILVSIVCLALASPAAAQDAALDPEAAARTVEPVDAPPRQREVDDYLAAELEAERARLGQIPPEARALEAALRDTLEPHEDEASADEGSDPAAVARSAAERVEEQARPPTDAESRDPALPPALSREEELDASLRASSDPRRAPSVTRTVELELELDARGRVHQIRVSRSSGRRALDVAARRATERLIGRSFGEALALRRVDVRVAITQRVTRMGTLGATFDLGGGEARSFALGRGLSASSVRVVRVRAPR